jgi:hypothetical protein
VSNRKIFCSWLLLLSIGLATAAPFDDKMQTPKATSSNELRSQLRKYGADHRRLRDAMIARGQVSDDAMYRSWIDAEWRLVRAMEEKMPMGDLSELGLIRNEDGSYSVDAAEHPEWFSIDLWLDALRDQPFAPLAARLRERGFSEQGVTVLQDYLRRESWQRPAMDGEKAVVADFANRIRTWQRAGKRIDREQVVSFMYQSMRQRSDARHDWVRGLLSRFDKQQQRILASLYSESKMSRTYLIVSDFQSDIDQAIAMLSSGKYLDSLQQAN